MGARKIGDGAVHLLRPGGGQHILAPLRGARQLPEGASHAWTSSPNSSVPEAAAPKAAHRIAASKELARLPPPRRTVGNPRRARRHRRRSRRRLRVLALGEKPNKSVWPGGPRRDHRGNAPVVPTSLRRERPHGRLCALSQRYGRPAPHIPSRRKRLGPRTQY